MGARTAALDPIEQVPLQYMSEGWDHLQISHKQVLQDYAFSCLLKLAR